MKKFVTGLAAIVLATGLTACGGGGSGDSDGEIVIGVVAPLTGGFATTATNMVNSAKLAAAEINEDGGIDGKKLTIKVYDDQLSADTAARVTQRAITADGAEIIVGGLSTTEALAIREVTERNGVVYMATAAVTESVTEGSKYVYRVAPLLGQYASTVVDVAAALGSTSPGLLHDNSAAGVVQAPLFEARIDEIGLDLAGAPVQYTINATDVSAQVSAVAGDDPDSVLLGGSSGADQGLIVKSLVEQGVDVPVVAFSTILSADSLKVGGDAFDQIEGGVYSLQDVDFDKPEYQEYAAKMSDEYGDEGGVLTEQATQTYDGLHVLAEALKASNGDASGDALAAAIEGLEPRTGASSAAGSTIDFSKGRDGLQGKYLVLYRVTGSGAELATDVTY